MKQALFGTGVALVTPFQKDGSVDYRSYQKLIDFVIEGGCNYVVALGTTGEASVLEKEEKIALIEQTYASVKERVPVVIGVGGNHTAAVEKDLLHLPLGKATAVLSVSPYYSKPSQQGIEQHYRVLASASPKPILLYDVPGRTGRAMAFETIVKLAQEEPNIIGIKDASGDLIKGMKLLKHVPESFLVISGDDHLALAQIACGMQGVISVAANAFPGPFSQMVQLALKKDLITARGINERLMDAYDLMFCENNPAGVKAFLADMQLLENHLRLPNLPLSEHHHLAIRTFLKNFSA